MYEDFLKEKRFLLNATERTLEWYDLALKWLPNERPSERDLKSMVVKMREQGLSARSINSYRTGINAYMHWLTGSDDKCSPQCKHPRVARMKDEQKILPTFSEADIAVLCKWKPKTYYERRLYTVLLTLADTGTRITEILNLKWSDLDFENNLMTVMGKGNKERKLPFSYELRKALYRWQKDAGKKLVFSTRQGLKLMRRNVLRDTKRLCLKLGIKAPERTIHAIRHTFAVHYLRRGGSVFHLQKMLGHSTLDMSRKYANLNVDDLAAVHQKCSLLSA